jgi:putative phage-type endonuclease
MEQGTEEWFAARLGRVTASRVQDIVARTKTGYAASRDNYLAQLVCERLTGKGAESFTNAAMAHGTETEPLARAAYEMKNSVLVDEVGFIQHPTLMAGASPDGMVGQDGLIEIKCPQTNTHIETLLSGKIPSKYKAQMTWQMLCTGRKWCDFISFDPRLPQELQMFVQRYLYDVEYANKLETEVLLFLAEVDVTLTTLNQLKENNGKDNL